MSRLDDSRFPWTRFGKLVALWPVQSDGRRMWECICDCGTFKLAQRHHLTSRLIQSCGCVRERHGAKGTPTYEAWKNMKKHGDLVCKPWRDRFTAFLAAVGERPSPKHLLVRLDPRLPFEPGNVIWSDSVGSKILVDDRELIGWRSGRLTASHVEYQDGRRYWRCQCDCGRSTLVMASRLREKTVKSCGCVHEFHGMSNHPDYNIWKLMRERCRNPKLRCYKNYGGRGIRVCRRWVLFSNFIADMGPRPTPHHTIDRIDVNGHYEPGNCRWATPREQNRNRRCNTVLTLNGESKCLQEWADDLGISSSTLVNRLADWPLERALTEKRHGRPRRE